jgi:hypothetical protein
MASSVDEHGAPGIALYFSPFLLAGTGADILGFGIYTTLLHKTWKSFVDQVVTLNYSWSIFN